MATLETLVKLASFGTSGVCVLAIFYVGKIIEKLPKEAPEWRIAIIKRYQNLVVCIAIISAVAGIANAYFNQGKIDAANKDRKEIEGQYKSESAKLETQKAEIERSIASIRQQLQSRSAIAVELSPALNELESAAKSLRIRAMPASRVPR